MPTVTPTSAQELAAVLREAAANSHTISAIGNNSKYLMGGPSSPADVTICTTGLKRVLQYEPNDLTVSVEAGMPWAELQSILARRGQMIALDPPFWQNSTVGGITASNSNGPLRRAFGTARDLIIGMQFAMLDGKLVRVGGMVVKNVAGLDIGKLMIGSFGTLAVMTSVNFRLHALPEETNTFLFSFPDLESILQKREALQQSVLRPLAIDLITPRAADRLGFRGYLLAVRAGGSKRVLARYARDLNGSQQLGEQDDSSLWAKIREFTADFLQLWPTGLVLRVSTPLSDISKLLRLVPCASITRAGSGVTYIYVNDWQQVSSFWQLAADHDWPAVIEYAPEEIRAQQTLWPSKAKPDTAFAMMKSIKRMFDPDNLLNRSRLYGRI